MNDAPRRWLGGVEKPSGVGRLGGVGQEKPQLPDESENRGERVRAYWVGALGAVLVLGGFALFVLQGTQPWATVLGIVAAMVGIVLLAVAKLLLDRFEAKAWRRHCDAHGWSYVHSDRGFGKQWAWAPPFKQGHSHIARNLVQGVADGVAFQVWNQEFTTGSGKSQQTHVYRVTAVAVPAAPAALTIERETAGKRLYDALGGEDIDFEWDEFSREFWVRCDDRKFAYDAVDARMMEFLMERGTGRTWIWSGTRLAVTVPGRMRRGDVIQQLADAVGFQERLPRHLVRPKPIHLGVDGPATAKRPSGGPRRSP